VAPLSGRIARVAAACALVAGMMGQPAFPEVTDIQVKVAFLYNFAKYTKWPPDVGPGRLGVFPIAILGADPFGAALDDMLRGKAVGESQVVVRRIARPEDVEDARILYISESEADQLPRILKRLEGTAVLTVGEMSRFAERGGVVQLKTEGNRVRLEINLGAAERARLKISSELLKLARIVDQSPGD
jgi:uncharacterized protein DUF4154